MTVLDTGALLDYLLDGSAAGAVAALLEAEGELAAPDLVVFEALAVLRRLCLRGELSERRAGGAVSDLADVPLELFASLSLRDRAWELKDNLATADALFVALAEQLGEPLLTRDAPLAAAVSSGAATTAQVILLEAA